MNVIKDVEKWNEMMGVRPGHDQHSIELGGGLVVEELEELVDEILTEDCYIKDDIDMDKTAKELGDLLFVVVGLGYRLGIDSVEALSRVNDSNYSKFCNNFEDAVATMEHYKEVKSTPCYVENVGDYYAVYRESDNKVLKPICYKEADMSGTWKEV